MKRMFLLLLGDEFKEYFSLTTKQKFYVWYFCLVDIAVVDVPVLNFQIVRFGRL